MTPDLFAHGDDILRRMKLASRGIPSVGAIAIATRRTGVCDVGERGVCYEEYARTWRQSEEDHPSGYSFLFESGRFDGFSLDEVREFLTLTGNICADLMHYRFQNVSRLTTDFQTGRFLAAFPSKRKR